MTAPPSRVGPLVGLKIVELGHYIAGPFCTRVLADLGAEVVKIEPPAGDPIRGWGAKVNGHPVSIVHVPIYYELHPVVPGKKDGAPGTRNWFEERFFVGIDAEKQPLSWHLRECEKEDIRKRLEDLSGSTEFSTIRKFFEPEPTPP